MTAALAGRRGLLARELRPVLNLLSLVILGGMLGAYLLWCTRGRDYAVGVAAEFYLQPPEEVPPGMIGTLLDERAERRRSRVRWSRCCLAGYNGWPYIY